METNPVTFANTPPSADKIMKILADIYARENGVSMQIVRVERG